MLSKIFGKECTVVHLAITVFWNNTKVKIKKKYRKIMMLLGSMEKTPLFYCVLLCMCVSLLLMLMRVIYSNGKWGGKNQNPRMEIPLRNMMVSNLNFPTTSVTA